MENGDPLPPWPAAPEGAGDPVGDAPAGAGQRGSTEPAPTGAGPPGPLQSGKDGQPTERQVACWLLALGGEWHLCGRTLMERHLVRTAADLPEEVSALLGAKLPPQDPRTDAILERLSSCEATRGLSHLDLARTSVSAAGLRSVAQFAWLEGLDLSATPLQLEDLAPLKGLPELSRIELAGTPMGHLEHSDLFGQTAVPGALRHPVGAVQRTLARLVDLALVAACLPFPIPLLGLDTLPEWALLLVPAALSALALVPLEALLLSLVGATPGKALLRVMVVTPAGTGPGPLAALKRSTVAAFAGWAAGLRPFSWILGGLWILRLGKGVETPWDRIAGTRSIPRACAGWRLLVAGAVIAGSWIFQHSFR